MTPQAVFEIDGMPPLPLRPAADMPQLYQRLAAVPTMAAAGIDQVSLRVDPLGWFQLRLRLDQATAWYFAGQVAGPANAATLRPRVTVPDTLLPGSVPNPDSCRNAWNRVATTLAAVL